MPCAWINLDQTKAFDRVSHLWLFKVLKAYGFGPDFIQWISVLYTDISSSVIVNGHISEEFAVGRSVRQGDPLSPMLYVLSIEPFAERIRLCPDIKGIQLPGGKVVAKISQFADDSTFMLSDINSVRLVLEECQLYGTVSGALLNLAKSCAMWLGRFKTRQDKPFGLNWVTSKKLLGVVFGYGDNRIQNWGAILKKFESGLKLNQFRNISMYGRAVLANTLGSSKLYYIGSYLPLPKDYEVKFTRVLFNYVWGGQHGAIKRETLYGHPECGGIALVCPGKKCQALLIRHIFQFLNFDSEDYLPKWTHLTVYWIGLNLRKYRPDYWSNSMPHCLDYRPPFYEAAMKQFLAYKDSFPNSGPFDSVKNIYNNLMTQVVIPPLIEMRGNYPQIDFKAAWKASHSRFIDPELRTLNFRICHRTLPVNVILFERGNGATMDCTFCGKKYCETLEHLFIHCKQAMVVWFFVKKLLRDLCNHRLKLDSPSILFCQLPRAIRGVDRELILYIISLAKHSIWMTRCQRKYEVRVIDGATSLRTFKNRLRFRISVDFIRYNQLDCIERWGRGISFVKLVAQVVSLPKYKTVCQ